MQSSFPYKYFISFLFFSSLRELKKNVGHINLDSGQLQLGYQRRKKKLTERKLMILTEKQVSQSEYSQKWRGSDRELFSSFFSLLSRPTAIGSFLADEKKKRYTLDVIRFCFFKNFVILSIVCETNE
jgi:hypothetical protein